MEITFDTGCRPRRSRPARRRPPRDRRRALSGKTLGASLLRLRDAMRAQRFRAAGSRSFSIATITRLRRPHARRRLSHPARLGRRRRSRPIPTSSRSTCCTFSPSSGAATQSSERRAGDSARLLLHARARAADHAHLGRWRSGREPRSVERDAGGAAGPERQRPAVCRRRRDADADRHVALRAGRVGLRQAARRRCGRSNEAHQFKIGLGHASSMGCHLRFGFEAQCGRDTLALRDDNIADYPWLCFALSAVMREYVRPALRAIESRDRAVIEEALLNGLTPTRAPSSACRRRRCRSRKRIALRFVECVHAAQGGAARIVRALSADRGGVFAAVVLLQLLPQRRQRHGRRRVAVGRGVGRVAERSADGVPRAGPRGRDRSSCWRRR